MRIVLTTWGSCGDLNPYIGLALGLRARGHEPILATIPRYRADVEREGLAYRSRPADTGARAAVALPALLEDGAVLRRGRNLERP